jgi:alkylation response protein AidB-like acyl-CoA dehydrogenase
MSAMTSQPGLAFDLTDEQRMLRATVHDFVERECPKPIARQIEAAGEYPTELGRKIAAAGLSGIGIPEEFGGQGGDIIDQVIVCEELSRSLAGLAWMWGIPVWSGAKAVIHYGTEAQRRAVLPGVADGSTRFAFALTEPGGGTDVLRAMRTRAVRVDGGWVLRGNKIWSTMSDVADRIQVLARTSDGERAHHGLSMFLVDGDAPGLTATPLPKIGMRALNSCELAFEDVFVPNDMILGEEGSGWKQVLTSLNSERIMTAAMCTGILRGVLEDAVLYAQQREAFGKPIGAMQAIQHGIADIKMNLETAWLHTYRAAWLERAGRPCAVESATAKVLASEAAVAGADYGIQVLGGYGYSQETDMQRYWRDARLYRIGPISSEMARNFIGESLGLPRSF